MRKFIIDFEFNQNSGETRIVIDFNDNSMSAIEINEAVKSGELLEEVLRKAAELFGDDVAQQVRDGKVAAVCLDNHPELRKQGAGIQINQQTEQKQELKQ